VALDEQAFWSGTEETYGVKQLFGETGLRAAIPTAPLSATAPATPGAPPGPAPSQPENQAPRPPALSATLSFLPPDKNIAVGQETRLDILVANVDDLTEGTLTVSFDPKILEFRQALEGEFLKRGGSAAVVAEVNPVTGTVVLRLNRGEGAKGVSGAGVLATLSFVGKGPGQSPVAVQTARLLNAGKAALPSTGGQGVVRVQ